MGIILCITACEVEKKHPEPPLARVDGVYLYPEDVRKVTGSLSGLDSALLAQNYIREWLKEQVLINKAKYNIPNYEQKFYHQIKQYENSLLIYEFEQRLVTEKLDTTVSELEIEEYYEANKPNYVLKQAALQIRYVKTDSINQVNKEIKKRIGSNHPDDMEELKSICINHAEEYFFDDLEWFYMSDILSKIPLKEKITKYLRKEQTYVIYNQGSAFIVFIADYVKQGEFIPVEMVSKEIKKQLLNQRKIRLVKEMRNELYNQALNNKDAEIYTAIK